MITAPRSGTIYYEISLLHKMGSITTLVVHQHCRSILSSLKLRNGRRSREQILKAIYGSPPFFCFHLKLVDFKAVVCRFLCSRLYTKTCQRKGRDHLRDTLSTEGAYYNPLQFLVDFFRFCRNTESNNNAVVIGKTMTILNSGTMIIW